MRRGLNQKLRDYPGYEVVAKQRIHFNVHNTCFDEGESPVSFITIKILTAGSSCVQLDNRKNKSQCFDARTFEDVKVELNFLSG